MAGSAASVLSRLIQNAARPKKPPRSASAAASHILAHLDSGDLRRAISVLAATPAPLPLSLYTRLLRLCSARRALVEARRVESHVISTSPTPSTFLLNRAIETYADCSSLKDARELFEEMPNRDGGTWNAIISAYARSDQPYDVLLLFVSMNGSGVRANDVTFACVLGACANLLALFFARQAHGLILRLGFCSNVILGTSLVDVYGKCWIMGEAQRMFDEIPDRNAVSWNVIVRRYLEVGRGDDAVVMFFRLIREGVRPLNFTVSSTLVACWEISGLREGCEIHGVVVKIGFEEDPIVGNSLIGMYAKCGLLEDAQRLFDQSTSRNVVSWTSMVSGYVACGRIDEAEKLFGEMPERNVVSWNAMLAGYVRFCCWDKALDFISCMQKETEEVDAVTLSLISNVCAGLSDLERGKQVHGFTYRHGLCLHPVLANSLLDMYGKCGSLIRAEHWFLEMGHKKDRISWNVLISSYTNHGRSEYALTTFSEMLWEIIPNEFTLTTVLAACANIFMLEHGKQIHGYMLRNGFKLDFIVRGALVDMYSKCRSIEYAIKVFKEEKSPDLILCNSMILGCAYNGRGEYGLELFEAMQKNGISVDHVTFIGVLLACISEGFVSLGHRYFNLMNDEYGVIPRVEHYECMIELLGKNGYMVELEGFIDQMPFEPTTPMWTRIFDCCREHGTKGLGERAARCINESNPLNPVRFEVLAGLNEDAPEPSICRNE